VAVVVVQDCPAVMEEPLVVLKIEHVNQVVAVTVIPVP
jgi:hypothetical protein